MHALEEASNFNESMYFNVYDPAERIGGFLRLGNRANEGYAELTTCLYLPDGRVAFMYNRPEIANNDAFDAGGTRFEVVTPFEELRTTYDGKVALLDEPLQMANPRKAFTENPWVEAHVDLTHRGVSPMYGGEPVNDDGSPLAEDHSGGFARGHYEQHMAVDGHDPRRRRRVGGRRLRPARPLVGPALLAGAVVVPLAHRELRRRTSASSSRSSRRATAAGATAAWCCATASTTTSTHATIETVWTRRRRVPRRDARHRDDRGRHVRDHRAACSTSSRCATAARRPRASSS